MAIGKNIFELEEAIGYKFSDVAYLERALTHTSYSFEMKNKGRIIPSNERLEFLGDSVLELIISEHLFESFNECREGVLTKMRQYLVCDIPATRQCQFATLYHNRLNSLQGR